MGAILLEWWALSFLGVFANKILIPSSCSNFTGLWTRVLLSLISLILLGRLAGDLGHPFFVALQVWFKFKITPTILIFGGLLQYKWFGLMISWLEVENPEDPGILAWRTSNKPQPNLVLATRRGQDSGSWPWLYCRIWSFPCTGVAGLADRYPLEMCKTR